MSLLAPLSRGSAQTGELLESCSGVGPSHLLETSLPLPAHSLSPIHPACLKHFSPFFLPILVVLFGVYIVSSLHDLSSETFREQVSPLFKILVTPKSNLRILIWPLGEASGNHWESLISFHLLPKEMALIVPNPTTSAVARRDLCYLASHSKEKGSRDLF